jgi:NADPH2:quinone reductase
MPVHRREDGLVPLEVLQREDLILYRGSVQDYGAYTSTSEEWHEPWQLFWRLADAGQVKVLFQRSLPFDQEPQALHAMATQRPFGGVALHF